MFDIRIKPKLQTLNPLFSVCWWSVHINVRKNGLFFTFKSHIDIRTLVWRRGLKSALYPVAHAAGSYGGQNPP